MTGSEVAAFLRRYGADAPVRTGVDVLAAFPMTMGGGCGPRWVRCGAGCWWWRPATLIGHRWLPAPALHQTGQSDHVRGIGAMHGLYFLGMKWMHRRSSHTIDGVGSDAEYVGEQMPQGCIRWSWLPPRDVNRLGILHSLLGLL